MNMEKFSEIIDIIKTIADDMDSDYPRECEESLLNIWEWSQELSSLVERGIPNHSRFSKNASSQSDKNKKIIMKLIDLIELMDLKTETEKIQKLFDIAGELMGGCRIFYEN